MSVPTPISLGGTESREGIAYTHSEVLKPLCVIMEKYPVGLLLPFVEL